MKVHVVLRPLVPSDLLEITSYLFETNPQLSQRFASALRDTMD